MGDPWVRSAVLAAAQLSHGPPHVPPSLLTAPVEAPQPLSMFLVEEEEKHREQHGREHTLS